MEKVKRHAAVDDFPAAQAKSARGEWRRVTPPRAKRAVDVTGVLQAQMRGDPNAPADLASLVPDKLRPMAKRMLAGARAATVSLGDESVIDRVQADPAGPATRSPQGR